MNRIAIILLLLSLSNAVALAQGRLSIGPEISIGAYSYEKSVFYGGACWCDHIIEANTSFKSSPGFSVLYDIKKRMELGIKANYFQHVFENKDFAINYDLAPRDPFNGPSTEEILDSSRYVTIRHQKINVFLFSNWVRPINEQWSFRIGGGVGATWLKYKEQAFDKSTNEVLREVAFRKKMKEPDLAMYLNAGMKRQFKHFNIFPSLFVRVHGGGLEYGVNLLLAVRI